MALLEKILGAMRDDKGVFQGGEYGRNLGRLRDRMGSEPSQSLMEEGSDYTPPPSASIEDQERMTMAPEGNRLDFLLKNFDPSSNESVLDLQKALNSSGALRGNKLSEDGMFGKKTLAAIRDMQKTRDNVLSGRGDNRLIGPRTEDGSFREGFGGSEKEEKGYSFPSGNTIKDGMDESFMDKRARLKREERAMNPPTQVSNSSRAKRGFY